MALVQVTLVASDNSANSTVTNLNPLFISSVGAATAGQIADFPTALTQIVYRTDQQTNAFRDRTLLTATATATVLSAISAAQAGTLGAGVSGLATLVAGTKAITIAGLTSASVAVGSLVTPNTGSSTVKFSFACTTNTLTITALVAAGTINVADISVMSYAIVG